MFVPRREQRAGLQHPEDETEQAPRPEAREVGEDIGPSATHPKEGEKRDSAPQGHPAIDLSPPPFPCVGCEDAQGREDRRGRPDRCVARGLDEGIEGVAERAREQHSGPREPPAQEFAREKAEDEAEDQVTGQVDRVDVKAEGRHSAPPLALTDQAGVAHARPQPVEGEGLVPLQDVNEQYGHAIEARADQSVMNPEARIEAWRPRLVLVQIEPELLPGVVRVSRMNHQSELTVAGQHLASDAHGLEHESVLHAALLRTRSVNQDSLELGILHGASGASERITGRRAGPRRDMKDVLYRHLDSLPGSLSRHTLAQGDVPCAGRTQRLRNSSPRTGRWGLQGLARRLFWPPHYGLAPGVGHALAEEGLPFCPSTPSDRRYRYNLASVARRMARNR